MLAGLFFPLVVTGGDAACGAVVPASLGAYPA